MKPHTALICGFDRAGTSVVSRALARHPQVELFMQPFNSGPVRRKMNEIWTNETATSEDIKFFRGLETGNLVQEYIRSDWFERSTTRDFIPGKIHVVKTTLNHFVTGWSQRSFPGIDHWAVWRDPMDILASLVRNGFIDAWYSGAIDEIQPAIVSDRELTCRFGRTVETVKGNLQAEAALIIAVRTFALFREIPASRVISFDRFVRAPIDECARFFSAYDLCSIAIDPSDDANIAGKRYEPGKSHRSLIEPDVQRLAARIFTQLTEFEEKSV
jgi:hypothetical protein